ncbi:hypothetical protein ACFYWX_33750 [Streptomyces sp. NPDC002888]|uniref:hypothetical protein n=1 Tax=Streptomyces sp. NPDC002888 TaxID=3364668 RepID=UPI00368B0EC4
MGLLSWLTRSGERSRGVTEPGTRAGADAGTTSPGPDAATDAQVTDGWRSTPPVQRTLSAPMGLLTDPGGFGRRLGTWQDPTVTGPLGHLVSAQAPSGVGHGLAEPTMPVQRTSVRPEAHAFGVSRGAQDPVRGDDGGSADRPGDPHGTGGPTVLRTVSPAGGSATAQHLDHAPSPGAGSGSGASVPDGVRAVAPAALPLAPLQRTTVLPTGPARDTAPLAPVMVMRVPVVPAAPAGPVPARPLIVAEPPGEPARELAAVPASLPDADPGPLAPGTPDEPVADLLATRAGQDEEGEGGVVQRTEASVTDRPTAVRDTAPLPLAAPRTGTAAGQGPDAAPTAPLIGGVDGAGSAVQPAVQPVVQRDVAAPPRPRHRGLGEPLSALPPTAVPLPGPAAPPTESAVSPSVPSRVHVSRTVEAPETPAAPGDLRVPHAPEVPAVPDLVAGPAEPEESSPDGEGTAPLLGDTPPLTTDPVDLGTGLSPETATGAGAEAVEVGPVPAPGAGPGSGTGPGLRSGSGIGPGSGPGSGLGTGSGSGTGPSSGSGPGPGPGPDAVSGSAAGSGGAASPGPVAVQRLDVPGGPPPAPPSTGETPVVAEADPAPLLGDAGPLAVSDTVVLEAPGPGELVTASTPLPMRRLDAVDEATLPGTVPETGVGAGSGTRGGGPVFPLVAQRSLPLYTVPEPALSTETPVASEPPAAVPIQWERVGGGASVSGAGGSGGRAGSAPAAPDGFRGPGDHGGPHGGHTATGGGSAYPGAVSGHAGGVVQRSAVAGPAALADGAPPAWSYGEAGLPGAVSGHAGGVVQRSAVAGPAALADGAPPAWSYGDTGRSGVSGVPGLSGLPGLLGVSGPPAFPGGPSAGAALPDGVPQPTTRALHGPGALGPAVPLQRLEPVRDVAPPPVRHSAPTAPPSPPPRGQAPSVSGVTPDVSAGAAAVAAGVARWMPDGSVEFTAPAVQRAEDGPPGTEPPADPPAQPEPVDPPAPSVAAGDSSTSAATGKAGGAGVPKVTDELVRALVAPLSRLLRAELRIERERAGTLINIRH